MDNADALHLYALLIAVSNLFELVVHREMDGKKDRKIVDALKAMANLMAQSE